MKHPGTILIGICIVLFLPVSGYAQDEVAWLSGAWQSVQKDSTGNEVTSIGIISDQYIVNALYNLDQKRFIGTTGGSWKYQENKLIISYEFNTMNPDMVGKEVIVDVELAENKLTSTADGRVWDRVDDGTPGELAQAWLITGREREGNMSEWVPGVRKTMKILSGTRFQWIAYNTETGEFFGTGGGTYTTEDGKYTENIEFFSRNKERVGASLQFDYELSDGQWHHRGKSSSGNPIYEIWSARSSLK